MNLVLIGFRCSGKTTVGKRLSSLLGRVFVDTDDLIEKREGRSISEMVNRFGWIFFRKVEREVILEISNQDDLVIAVGGGAVIEPENVKALKKNGFLIWLKADVDVLLERIAKDSRTAQRRPSLTGRGTIEEFREVLAHRERLYGEASDTEVDTSKMDVEGVVGHILNLYQKRMEEFDGRKYIWDSF